MKSSRFIGLCGILILAAAACGTHKKIEQIRSVEMQARLALPSDSQKTLREIKIPRKTRDTLQIVDFEGHEMLIMNAIRDEDGEMVATERLDAAVVTARFRNVAERRGRVDLEFQVIVPRDMQDSRWQLRLDPDMYILGDSLRLDPVIITGRDYRKAQLRGYEQYRRFLNSIITDTTRFINLGALEIFIERNIPEVYAFRNDTTYVSDEQFASAYGVTERQAVEHYTWKLWKRWNKRRAGRKNLMYRRFVKAPIVTEGIRLDTVIQNDNGDFIYNYVQTINTRPKLRKVEIVLSGDIREQGKRIYTIPRSEPLTFYISSISGLADGSERYLKKIIERKVEANTACYIEFPQGKANIDPQLGNNPGEIDRIKGNFRELLVNETFDLDSICVEAYASPEGAAKSNEALSERRARAASDYFSHFAAQLSDSLSREAGIVLALGDEVIETLKPAPISFNSRSGGENWQMLDVLIESDEHLKDAAKQEYKQLAALYKDPDIREKQLSRSPHYRYLREKIYPRLRVVKFNFFLHRKGMLKDTVHTTELDTVYMRGVQYLRDHDYEEALKRLQPYKDFNTAVAYVALDRNSSAMEILRRLEPDGPVNYLLAILYSREGDEQRAVQCYVHACAQEPSYVHRGNLDPEISALIKKYDLNNL
ncbi:MAG: hypothetical protein IJL86_08710 [Bacteroidales bacterium]|nr:hypothetical protein [Bacteroidales bacterium]